MDSKELFLSKRAAILERWRDHVLASYPQETVRFLKSQKDPFANPVGKRISVGLSGVLDIILEGSGENEKSQEAMQFLDDLIKVRAVQGFAPGAAMRFLFDLKDIVFAEVAPLAKKLGGDPDWRAIDRRIDAVALAGLDAYVRCREKIFDIRINELRKLSHSAMVRAGLVAEIPELSGSGEGCKKGEEAPEG
ncbi:MAG: RsbRD N-terminal domain-containing protein [Thermodesulfobacteriota bacterium]